MGNPGPARWVVPMALVALLVAPLSGCKGQQEAAAQQREQGLRLLAQYQCTSCHAIPQVPGPASSEGASLAQWGLRSYIAGQVPNRPELLVRWIMAPASLVPDTSMPAMGVTAADAQKMAAYLHALR